MKSEKAGCTPNGVRLEKFVAHSQEQVWQALTDPNALAQWLLPSTFKPNQGHRFHFTRTSDRGRREKVRCQVVELDAPRRLAYTWQADSEDTPSLVTWTLDATAEGTCLRLEHTGLETSCLYRGGSPSSVTANFAEKLTRFLSTGGLQVGQMRVGRIALQTSVQPCRCVRRRNAGECSRTKFGSERNATCS